MQRLPKLGNYLIACLVDRREDMSDLSWLRVQTEKAYSSAPALNMGPWIQRRRDQGRDWLTHQ